MFELSTESFTSGDTLFPEGVSDFAGDVCRGYEAQPSGKFRITAEERLDRATLFAASRVRDLVFRGVELQGNEEDWDNRRRAAAVRKYYRREL